MNWQQDPHGNWIARYVFPEKTTEFAIAVDFVADMQVINPFDFFVEPYADIFPFEYPEALRTDLAAFLEPEPAGPLLKEFMRTLSREPMNTVNYLVALNQKLQTQVRYVTRMEPGVQTPDETLQAGSGSCRDSAWLLVQIVRQLGMPARFVSGYLIQLKPDLKPLDGPAGATQDFTDLHAWTEVYIPGAGWIGFDPTSGLLCGEGHLPVAATPHYRSAAPITGAVDAAEVDFAFEMRVSRIAEKPRVTFPFSDAAWAALDALGDKIDADLEAQDVRLTMGGEPTFVSIDDYQSAEWNTDALGPTKRIRADELIRRLRERYAPGGFLHYSQGKWYPGEPLPRWAFALFWRKDGFPIWRDESLIAREGQDHAPTVDLAKRFAEGVAARLGIDRDYLIPAFEDPIKRMIKEGEWPDNIDPSNPKIDDPLERARIMREFEQRVSVPTGYVLPVQPANALARADWLSEIWPLRRGRLFLIPGDSPIGFRLPLDSLPYLPPSERPVIGPVDPFVPRSELPHPDILFQRAQDRFVDAAAVADDTSESAQAKRRKDRAGGTPGPHRARRRDPRRASVRLRPAGRAARGLSRAHRRHRSDRGRSRDADPGRRIWTALRSPHQRHQGHARPRRDRGQYPPLRALARGGRDHPRALRGGPPHPPRHRQVHDRRPPHRHRRRQPCRARRRHRRGQPVPAPARSPEEHRAVLAASPVPVVPVFRACSSARPARRRASTRRGRTCCTNARSRSAWCPSLRSAHRCPGWSTGCSAISWSTSPATPIAPKSASTSCTLRRARPAGSVWSNSARSRCRPTPA